MTAVGRERVNKYTASRALLFVTLRPLKGKRHWAVNDRNWGALLTFRIPFSDRPLPARVRTH